jgi:hypothetical protein
MHNLGLVDRFCYNFRNVDMQGASGRVGIEETTHMRDYETITSNSEEETREMNTKDNVYIDFLLQSLTLFAKLQREKISKKD